MSIHCSGSTRRYHSLIVLQVFQSRARCGTLRAQLCKCIDNHVVDARTTFELSKSAAIKTLEHPALAGIINPMEVIQTVLETVIAFSVHPEPLTSFVHAYELANKRSENLKTVLSIVKQPEPTSEDMAALRQCTIAFDVITVLQVLSRPIKHGETRQSLAMTCFQVVGVSALPSCVRSALEYAIPPTMLSTLQHMVVAA